MHFDRGLGKMTPVTTDSWRDWCDSAFWCDEEPGGNMDFRAGAVVFCKIDEAPGFFERLRLTRKRVILVTGEGDLPCDALHQKFLPANVARWFATNVTTPHPRTTAIPLGLGSPRSEVTLRAEEILDRRASGSPRDHWLYVNFRPDTNPTVRQPVFDDFRRRSASEDWITFQSPGGEGTNASFLEALVRHRFVLCPPGNGVDTHRMWEALLAGAVPVVLRSQAMEAFSSLPILFVEDVRQVTREFLESAAEWFPDPSPIHPLMTQEFWNVKIREARDRLAGKEMMGWSEWAGEALSYGMEMLGRRLKRHA